MLFESVSMLTRRGILLFRSVRSIKRVSSYAPFACNANLYSETWAVNALILRGKRFCSLRFVESIKGASFEENP